MTDIYGQLMGAVHELAPNADATVGFALVVWDVHGNVAAVTRRSSDVPYGPDLLPVINGALVNQRHFEALN